MNCSCRYCRCRWCIPPRPWRTSSMRLRKTFCERLQSYSCAQVDEHRLFLEHPRAVWLLLADILKWHVRILGSSLSPRQPCPKFLNRVTVATLKQQWRHLPEASSYMAVAVSGSLALVMCASAKTLACTGRWIIWGGSFDEAAKFVMAAVVLP